MGRVWGVDIAGPLAAAEFQDFAMGEGARRAVGHIVQRYHAARLALRRLGVRCGGEPLIQGAALVCLKVAVGDPAQLPGRYDAADSLMGQREYLARAGVKQQRLVSKHEELVEDESGRRGDLRHKSRQAKDAIG